MESGRAISMLPEDWGGERKNCSYFHKTWRAKEAWSNLGENKDRRESIQKGRISER